IRRTEAGWNRSSGSTLKTTAWQASKSLRLSEAKARSLPRRIARGVSVRTIGERTTKVMRVRERLS
ncbi:hypothetical protein, partial [Puniceicoccus vermicola]|uniref:hypothetical protein n=1 Tax=Puniceicoccus vermicola TaxID=388746 RepID=UPI001C8BA087